MNTNPPSSTTNRRYLLILGVLFVLLGLGYSNLTPIFENSDETLHYPYVKHLADGHGLPLAEPGQLWHQEGTQPPLYYALAAAATFWLDTANLPDHLQLNPHWRFTDVRLLLNDNQNRVLHGPMDAFPYQRAALAIHIGRWLSLLFGLITVICTFLIAQHLFPGALPLAISATALTALTPQFIRVSATVSNDSLSAALASLAVLLALKFTRPITFPPSPLPRRSPAPPLPYAPFTTRHALLLGLLSGLALLTKLSSLTTLLLVALVLFGRLFFLGEAHQQPAQKLLRWLLIIAAVVLLLNGWWFFRNYRLYGEWLATETHLNLAGRGHLSLGQIWSLRTEIERAYWATFGWGQIRPPEWVYQLLSLFSRIGLVALLLAVITKLVQGDKTRPLPLNTRYIHYPSLIFLGVWVALNLALYLRWVTEVGTVSHTRLIFPAITALSLLLAIGWHVLLPRRLEPGFSGLLTVGLLALNLYSLGWLIKPAFTPEDDARPRGGEEAAGGVTFLDSLQLVSGNVYPGLPDQPDTSPDIFTIEAQWRVLAPIESTQAYTTATDGENRYPTPTLPKSGKEQTPPPVAGGLRGVSNYSVSAVLLAPTGEVLAHRETYPGLGLRPTRYLAPGETFVDFYPLTLTTTITEPIIARAVVSLFDVTSAERAGFPALDAAGNTVTPEVGRMKLTPNPWPIYQPQHAANVTFNQAIKLIGYDFNPATPANLTLYWQSLAPVAEDYQLFIHLLDTTGQTIAQADAPPTGGAYPTGWWSPGETIADKHSLPLTPTTIRLRLGFYSLTTGQRLPITESDLPMLDNGVELTMSNEQ